MSYYYEKSTGDIYIGRITMTALPVIILAIIIFSSFRIVGAGQRGVVLNWGAFNGVVLEPGLHWKTPFMTKIVKMDVQTQKDESSADAASKDLNNVKANVAVNFHIDAEKVGIIYQNIGQNYVDRIVSPAIQEAVKASTAKYTAEELVTKREVVKGDMVALLSTRLSKYNILLDEVSITNFDFSQEFNTAIESKVKAEQDALASKNKLEQVKYEAQQKIETAKADAESIRIQGAALQANPALVQLKWVEKWDGKQPTTILGSSVPLISIPTAIK